jgi:hypothetical protein
MPLTQSELLDLIDEVNVAVAQAIASYAELNEGMIDDAATGAAKEKLERLKAKTDDAKQRLADLKDQQRHKAEVERQRRERERERQSTNESKSPQSRVALLNAKGQWIGWVETQRDGKVNVYDARGRIVARELNGITLDRTGRFVGRGRQGLVVLGQGLQSF